MVSQSSSVGYTIMGKTADLTVVQKTTIDTLHKEGKTQKVIAKEKMYGVLWRGRCDMPDPTMQKSWRPLSEQPGLS